MKIENIKAVKARFNRIVSDLRANGRWSSPNGKPCAVLMPITKDTDLEIVALSQNQRFWRLYDSAIERADKKGWTPLEEA